MKYTKKEIVTIILMCFVVLFAILLVEKLIKIKVNPDALLFSEERKLESIVKEGIGKKPVTHTFSDSTSYVLVVEVDKGTSEKKYTLITPGEIGDPSKFKDDKHGANLLMQIVSGSNDANAGRCNASSMDCSGTTLDSHGYVIPKCWCK